ncbi:DUF1343 domain-containing protein [Bacillus licheniformis]|nr:DUF1343 domain-containing protein [Bacillus licheniformis]
MDFYLVDVFAETKYTGNQLAVFKAEKNLSSGEMQKIAREINFSETTFILGKHFNRLIGNGWVKTMIEQGASIDEIAKKYEAEQKRFMNIRKKYLLY